MTGSFVDLLKRLIEYKVDFVIVGGFAAITHGCTYVTQDIDICLDFSKPNLLNLYKALSSLNPVHRMTPKRQKLVLSEESCEQFKNLYLDTDLGQLDCLGFINGIGDYKTVKKASKIISVENTKLKVLSIESLIKSKEELNRPKDKQAIAQLKVLKKLKK